MGNTKSQSHIPDEPLKRDEPKISVLQSSTDTGEYSALIKMSLAGVSTSETATPSVPVLPLNTFDGADHITAEGWLFTTSIGLVFVVHELL